MRVLFILLQAVIVQPPSTTIVANLPGLHDVCGSAANYDACTLFVAYRLNVTCREAQMNASVTFKPMVFLYNLGQLPHEQLHIDDLKRFASQYVGGLEARTFASNTECEEESIRLAAGFGSKMREFALRSNLERHPILRAGRSTIPHVEGR